jgi:hypothetical protein
MNSIIQRLRHDLEAFRATYGVSSVLAALLDVLFVGVGLAIVQFTTEPLAYLGVAIFAFSAGGLLLRGYKQLRTQWGENQ